MSNTKPGFSLTSLCVLSLIGIVLFSSGCAERVRTNSSPSKSIVRVWPELPEAPRVEFVSWFSEPKDLGIRGGTLAWLQSLVFGERQVRLVRPMAVLVDGEKIYVADPGAKGVHRFDQATGSYRLIQGENNGALPSPIGLALGNEGQVYVTDAALGQVLTINPSGKEALVMQLGIELQQPTGIAFDQETSQLFVVDTLAHQIQVFDANGHWLRVLGEQGGNEGQFNYPTLLWLEKNGLLHLTDALNFRIQTFDRDGVWLGKFGRHGDGTGNLARHKGIATDSYGHIYVVDSLFHAVQIFDPQGKFLLSVGEQGQAPGEFWLPSGIFIDAQDRIYVADSYNRRVQIFRYVGGDT